VRATCRRRLRRIAGDEACSTRVTLRESYANVEIHAGSPSAREIPPAPFCNTDDDNDGGTIIRARFVKLCKADSARARERERELFALHHSRVLRGLRESGTVDTWRCRIRKENINSNFSGLNALLSMEMSVSHVACTLARR